MKRLLFPLVFVLSLAGCDSFRAAMHPEPIEDDPGERTTGAKVEDQDIEKKGYINIRARDARFEEAHFDVNSYNGFVLITGQVPDEDMKGMASDVVRQIRGVRRIYNELEIAGNTSTLTRSSDTWLTTKVKGSLLGSEDIEGSRVKVITENGVVYLMGLVSRAESERIINVARSTGGVEKVVQLFEFID